MEKEKLDDLKKECVKTILAMHKYAPSSVPLFVVYYNTNRRHVEAVPIGPINDKDIKRIIEAMIDPDTKKFENTLFTKPPYEN